MHRTVVLVEDLEIVREGLKSLIEAHSDFEVVADAGDGLAAIRAVERHQPDIVLMDLSMPKMGGVEAIRDVKRRFPDVRVLALTAYKREEHIRGALAAGADGFMLKTASPPELVHAMTTVLRGDQYVHPDIPKSFLEPQAAPDGGDHIIDKLTERERQVLKLCAEGRGNKAVADELCISVKTVEKHKANLVRKLGLGSATELLSFVHDYALFEE